MDRSKRQLGTMNQRSIPFYQHDLGPAEVQAITQALADPILTTGETVAAFERELASYLGRKHVVAVTSCTAALQLSLEALGIGPGDEVITTPLTFIATATAVIQAGATPVFADVEPETGNLDVEQVAKAITPRTKAIIPVHLYGQMCDMQELRALANQHDVKLIEDAAHCVEGSRAGVRPGDLAETVCFSFYATKNLTCGEGGAIATNDQELANRLRPLRLHGMTKNAADRAREGYTHWDMVDFGWKYNMDNLQAALLRPQLARLDENWERRQKLADYYREHLRELDGISGPADLPEVKHAHHLQTIWVSEARRDELLQDLQANGIGVTVNYRAIHLLTYFKRRFGFVGGEFPHAERIGGQAISLPFYPRMEFADVDQVVQALKDALHHGSRQAA
ncbi:MAG: DegT/DnrJ/EryC1/StrS family aminotransferase [Pirellulales bacterium]|nr:DegT/DnrJ/EryC1/StrS family aminotransferase [Pirellulales bacterium]